MTTVIVTQDKLAHDARGSNGMGTILSDEIGKSMAYKGDVYVGVGNASVFLAIMYFVIHGKPHPRWRIDGSGMVIISRHDGTTEMLTLKCPEKGQPFLDFAPVVQYPVAAGSGSSWAMAALDHGKDAHDAVEYAMSRDSCSGGIITVLDRFRKEPIEDYNLEWINGGNMKTLLEINGEEQSGHSMEDFLTTGVFQENMLFNLNPITLGFRMHPAKMAARINQEAKSILRPFQALKENWGFQVSGDVSSLHRYANTKNFTDWLYLEFYKPAGLQVELVPYLKALLASVKQYDGLRKDVLDPMTRYVNRCIGEPTYLLKVDRAMDGLVLDPSDYGTKLEGMIDRDDSRHRCKVDDLVRNNAEWTDVQNLYNELLKAFKRLDATKVLQDSERLAMAVIELAEQVEKLGDVDSIVGSANYKALIKKVEIIAYAVDGVGVLGYLIQQLETALRHNADLMKDAN